MFPKPTYKTGGTNTRKPSKNDRAMVSGVSSILRKIKDKKNRKEVAGDMVKQFNRERVNYNKEKFLKNSRSFAVGGPVKPIYTSNPRDPRLRSYNDSLSLYNNFLLSDLSAQSRGAKPRNFRHITSSEFPSMYIPTIVETRPNNFTTVNEINPDYHPKIKPVGIQTYTIPKNPDDRINVRLDGRELNYFNEGPPEFYVYKKPVQPVIYKPTSNTNTSTTSTTPINNPTPAVQTPRQLPANTSQMQRYNYMSTDDKKRAVKKYGDPSKVPTYVDLNKLRKEVPTFKKGGQYGGLDRWFAEKWVDVKSGKPCGRQEGENRAYPACRPSKRISSKTPKTSSELSSKEKARFKATKTSSQRIPYNHKRMQLGGMSSSDSARYQANKILKYEQLRGGPGGTPLPQYSDPKYMNMLMNDIYPEVKKIMPNATAMEAGEAMDFIFNAGWDKENKKILKDPRGFALQEYYRQYDKSKLDKDGNWPGRKQPISNELYANTIGKLPENQRRVLMNKGRDWYYKNTNNPAPGIPNPNYGATWYGRIWNTNDFLPFNPNNPKFIYKNK